MKVEAKSEEMLPKKQLDAEKKIYYKDVAGFLIFIVIVLIAYYVAVNLRQSG